MSSNQLSSKSSDQGSITNLRDFDKDSESAGSEGLVNFDPNANRPSGAATNQIAALFDNEVSCIVLTIQ